MTHRVHIYTHNDLLNLAHYHCEVIKTKISGNVDDAIALDCMSCLIALAFGVEAIINFVGSKKVNDWKEKSPSSEKMAALIKALKCEFDANRPIA